MCKHQQYILEVISEQSHQRGHLQLKIIKQFDTSTFFYIFVKILWLDNIPCHPSKKTTTKNIATNKVVKYKPHPKIPNVLFVRLLLN